MADKKDKKNSKKKGSSEDKTEKTSLIMTIVLVVVLVLILLGGFIAFVKLDIGNFGSKVLSPLIKDVPVINKILPDDNSEKIEEEESEYPYKSIEEAAQRIIELEKEIDKLKSENADINTKVDELNKENKRLKEFETEQEEFEKLKEKFDEEIVYGDDAPDTSVYEKYYQQMNPDTAEKLYKQVLEDQEASEEIKELANTYAKMDAGAAAKTLEKQTDISMVCDILNNMSQKSRAAIMNEMTAEFAAKVTSNMYAK